MKFNLASTLFLVLLALACIVQAGAPKKETNPEEIVDYVIEFDENAVKKEDMDQVADWLKQRGIEVKETELASYIAYHVAPLNRKLADELLTFGKEKQLHIEEVQPDVMNWSDLDDDEAGVKGEL